MYICIDAIGLHTLHLAWLPLLRSDLHSRVIETCYSHVYAHTLQMHQNDKLPDSHSLTDRSIIGRIVMNDSNLK